MTPTVKVQDAKTRLSALLAAVEAGEEVIFFEPLPDDELAAREQ